MADDPKDPKSDPAVLLELIKASAHISLLKKAAETGEVDENAVNLWLKDYWPQRRCPICQQSNWGLIPQFAHLSLGPLGPQLRPRTMPCVALMCNVCGHTVLFNALKMGLLPRGEE